jgi:hypothetical protein
MVERGVRLLGRVQRKYADKLQALTEKMSPRNKKLMLMLFILVFGGMSVSIVWRSITAHGNQSAVSVQPIVPSPPSGRPSKGNGLWPEGGVTAREYNMIRAFHQYLDSLGNTADGQAIRDSLLNGRPGLMDSIVAIEKMYLGQLKTEK